MFKTDKILILCYYTKVIVFWLIATREGINAGNLKKGQIIRKK